MLENPDIVRAVNAAFVAEAKWVNGNGSEAKHIVQKRTNYSDQIRDQFIAQKRQYRVLPVTDGEFVAELQHAADWLTARKVLPESIKVSDYLASV